MHPASFRKWTTYCSRRGQPHRCKILVREALWVFRRRILLVAETNHPINRGPLPPYVITRFFALVPFMKLNLALHFLPLAIKAGVFDPLINGSVVRCIVSRTTHRQNMCALNQSPDTVIACKVPVNNKPPHDCTMGCTRAKSVTPSYQTGPAFQLARQAIVCGIIIQSHHETGRKRRCVVRGNDGSRSASLRCSRRSFSEGRTI